MNVPPALARAAILTSVRDDPWLSDEQQSVWRAFLRVSGQLNECVERDMQQVGRMPHAYYLILAMLSESPDRSLRMNQLAEVVRASQSRVSHAVARLEQAGWVQAKAARILGMTPRQIAYRIQILGIEVKQF